MDEQPRAVPEQPAEPGEPAMAAVGASLDALPQTGDGAVQGHLPGTAEAVELIALIDRLEGVLDRSGLGELEVGSGATTIVLRSAASLAQARTGGAAPVRAPLAEAERPASAATTVEPEQSGMHAVVAPLTGIYYAAPSPDAAPYVRVGTQVVVGQVIGLIEAMKLYNEIKSDVAGRVVRLVAESGKLVKAKHALIEVEPS